MSTPGIPSVRLVSTTTSAAANTGATSASGADEPAPARARRGRRGASSAARLGAVAGDEQVHPRKAGDGCDRVVDPLLPGQRADVDDDRRILRETESTTRLPHVGSLGHRAPLGGDAVGDDADLRRRDPVASHQHVGGAVPQHRHDAGPSQHNAVRTRRAPRVDHALGSPMLR